MKPGSVLRVVRPTDNLAAIVKMYVEGLGFTIFAQFTDHEGFDGAILGHPQQPYHFAFTSQHGHHAGAAPTKDHLLVFYLPAENEWAESCRQMVAAGFRLVPSSNVLPLRSQYGLAEGTTRNPAATTCRQLSAHSSSSGR